jgi:hypothetical protein
MSIYTRLRANVSSLATKHAAASGIAEADLFLALVTALDCAVAAGDVVSRKPYLHAARVRQLAREYARRIGEGEEAALAFLRRQVGRHRPALGAMRAACLGLLAEATSRYAREGERPAVSDSDPSIADLAREFRGEVEAMLNNAVAA